MRGRTIFIITLCNEDTKPPLAFTAQHTCASTGGTKVAKNCNGSVCIDTASNTMDEINLYALRNGQMKIYCKNNEIIKMIMNGESYYYLDENYFTTDQKKNIDASTLTLFRRWEEQVNVTRLLFSQPARE